MTPEQYHAAEATLRHSMETLSLSCDAIRDIGERLANAEIEMAFESLGLSLMTERARIDEATGRTLLALGRDLGLDKESVFDFEFWDKFVAYLNI